MNSKNHHFLCGFLGTHFFKKEKTIKPMSGGIVCSLILILIHMISAYATMEKNNPLNYPDPVFDMDNMYPLSKSQIEYILHRYIQPADPSKKMYQNIYGHPEKAQLVLIVWTSLGCPSCSDIHETLIDPLKSFINSDFSMIVRDYPITSISLIGSSMIWACDTAAISSLMHTLHKKPYWKAESEESLNDLQKLIDTTYPTSSAHAHDARQNTESKQHVFQGRIEDKKALHLTVVPLVMVLEKQAHGWTGYRTDAPDGVTLKKRVLNFLQKQKSYNTINKK